jgi:cell wall-associated NlpC family hydrolase
MKRFIFTIFFIVSLSLSHAAVADISTKNVEGVVITFFTSKTEVIENKVSQEVLSQAMRLEGAKYKYGGNSPETGFDCSGFVNYVFNQAANVKLPRTTGGLSRIGQSVDQQELQPGDLVFFNTRRKAFSHVGIYIGDGDFIHAPSGGTSVRVENMKTGYWQQHYNGAKRLDEVAAN